MPSSVPVTPCVDSGIAYDDFAKIIERIHDVFNLNISFCRNIIGSNGSMVYFDMVFGVKINSTVRRADKLRNLYGAWVYFAL